MSDDLTLITFEIVMRKLHTLHKDIRQMTTKFQDEFAALTAQVAATDAGIDSAVTLIEGIPALLASAGVDPAVVAALRVQLAAETDKLAAAVMQVPGQPPPTP